MTNVLKQNVTGNFAALSRAGFDRAAITTFGDGEGTGQRQERSAKTRCLQQTKMNKRTTELKNEDINKRNIMKHIKLLLIGAALALPLMAQADIAGSKHDFSTNSWNLQRHSMCGTCHSIHDTDPAQLVPLWKHATTTKTFTMYDSPSFDGKTTQSAQPSGASKACLSCHDGSLAVNQSFSGSITGSGTTPGGTTNAVYVGTSRQIAADGNLATTHPISFSYVDVASKDEFIKSPSSPLTYATGNMAGKTVNDLLKGGKMECSSCHDVHKQKGAAPTDSFMRIVRNDYSELCLSCHVK
jgi:hypothetical protein